MWLIAIRHFLLSAAAMNLLWEFAQIPLYTIASTGSGREIVFAVLHCTGGDILISTAVLVFVLLVAGHRDWPRQGFGRVAVLTIVVGLGYTVFSEWLNTEIRGSWAYAGWMPRLPLIGTGLAPLLQWIVVPALAFRWTRRTTCGG
ncbi:MAG: hypothetical protein HY543_01520 [Deltaproteobacteria bacterium]|nr:hypothetical protein [Deltaproteobacteria bacterium]